MIDGQAVPLSVEYYVVLPHIFPKIFVTVSELETVVK